MAVGLPAKTTYANGDVFSASDINDTNGTINLIGQTNNFYAGKNKVINGDFGIWQRGTSFSFSSSGGYTADRFQGGSGGGGVVSITRQSFTTGQTDVPNAIYFFQANYSTSGTDIVLIDHRIEDVNTLAGQVATFSFYAKVNSGTKSVTPRLVQDFGSGGSTGVVTSLTSQTLTTSWQRFTISTTIPSISGKTVGANSYLRLDLFATTSGVLTYGVANVQLEAGATATAFQTTSGSIGGELALCQRYLPAISGESNSILGYAYSTTGSQIYIKLPTTARTKVTGITVNSTFSGNYLLINQGFTSAAPTAIALNVGGTDYIAINVTTSVGSPTLVAGQPVQFQTISSNGYILCTGCEL
jgi:hypothetical protein